MVPARTRIACCALIVTTLTASRGWAQQPAPAPPPAPPTATARPAGTVRLTLRAYKDKSVASLYAGRPDGAFGFICKTPCKVDVVPGTALRVTLGDSEEYNEFVISGESGGELEVEVRPPSKGALAGGIVMTSVGGLTALIGLLLLAVAAVPSSSDGDLRTAGYITLGVGGGLTIGGIMLIANRSEEPRVKQTQRTTTAGEGGSRAELFGPVAKAQEGLPVPPAFAPLSWAFQF